MSDIFVCEEEKERKETKMDKKRKREPMKEKKSRA